MKILIPKKIRKFMKRYMRQAGKKEIGGILMAEQIDSHNFRIVEFSVDARSGTTSSFFRNSANHDLELQDFFARTGENYSRFNYLGEWHTHPSFDVKPSRQDIKAMQDLVDDESSNLSFAVLLIAKLTMVCRFKSSGYLVIRGAAPLEVDVVYEY